MQKPAALVVVIDDDASTLSSLERLLHTYGYPTRGFASAEEFLLSGITHRATRLVVDIHLGGMSGVDLQRRLLAAGVTIPVVFITARDSLRTRAEAFAVGCDDYLQKPFDGTRLLQALERCAKS